VSSSIDFDLAMLGSSDIPDASVARRVTLAESVSGKGRWVRQNCCGGNFGIVELRLEPYRGPSQFQLVWQVTEEQIPEEFLAGVLEGIHRAVLLDHADSGLLTSIRIVIIGGAYHPVDSSQRAFTIATQKAFVDALAKTKLVMVE